MWTCATISRTSMQFLINKAYGSLVRFAISALISQWYRVVWILQYYSLQKITTALCRCSFFFARVSFANKRLFIASLGNLSPTSKASLSRFVECHLPRSRSSISRMIYHCRYLIFVIWIRENEASPVRSPIATCRRNDTGRGRAEWKKSAMKESLGGIVDSSAVISARSGTRFSVAVVDTAFHADRTKQQRNRYRRRYDGWPRAQSLCHAHEMKFAFPISRHDCEWNKRTRISLVDGKLIISADVWEAMRSAVWRNIDQDCISFVKRTGDEKIL